MEDASVQPGLGGAQVRHQHQGEMGLFEPVVGPDRVVKRGGKEGLIELDPGKVDPEHSGEQEEKAEKKGRHCSSSDKVSPFSTDINTGVRIGTYGCQNGKLSIGRPDVLALGCLRVGKFRVPGACRYA